MERTYTYMWLVGEFLVVASGVLGRRSPVETTS
jgi:hypothetical protein